mgnify:CR=1 FL=1
MNPDVISHINNRSKELFEKVVLYREHIHQNPELPLLSASGFSGHGFKFASVIGEVLADLATNGKTDWPIGFLRLSRFAR